MSGNRFTHIIDRQARLETRIDTLQTAVLGLQGQITQLLAKNEKLVIQLERAKGGYAMLAGIVTIAGIIGSLITHVLTWSKGQ